MEEDHVSERGRAEGQNADRREGEHIEEVSRYVVVTGLQVVSDPLLYDAFRPFGDITFLAFNRHEGAALVGFDTPTSAEGALMLDGSEVASHIINVMPFDPSRHPRLARALHQQHFMDAKVKEEGEYEGEGPASSNWNHRGNQQAPAEEEFVEAETRDGKGRTAPEVAGGEGPEMGLEFENARILRWGKPILFNFRDISFATFHSAAQGGVRIRPGIIYRSACWSRAPVSRQDVAAVLRFWKEACDIRTLLDLRSKAEKHEDRHDDIVEANYKTVSELDLYHYLPNETSGGPAKSLASTCPPYRRFPIDLVTRRLTYRGLMMSAPKRVYLKMMACSLRGRLKEREARRGGLMPSPSSPSLTELPGSTRTEAVAASAGAHPFAQDRNGHRRRTLAAFSTSAPDLRRNYPLPSTSSTTTSSSSSSSSSTPRGTALPSIGHGDQLVSSNLYEVDLEEEMIDASLGVNATTASQVFVSEVFNPLGLLGFTRLLLEYSSRELGDALRLLIDKRNHPILIHCSSGKDRTGLLVALVLSVCGVDRETIIENYYESEVYLRFVKGDIIKENRSKGLGEHFDGTPRDVMRQTLEFIEQRWGSIPAFLNSACLFSFVEQAYLRKLLVAS